jgi:hypothetical protein
MNEEMDRAYSTQSGNYKSNVSVRKQDGMRPLWIPVRRSENVIQKEPKWERVLDSAPLGEGPVTVTCE